MPAEENTATMDSTATNAVESTEANTESQPTNDVTDQTDQTQVQATELEEQKAFERATGRNWKDKAGQPEGNDEDATETETEVKDEPVKVELSDKAKNQVADLGIKEDDALAKAITAFERQRFDEEEIERRLSKGEARFIEDGLALAQQQKQVDSLFGRLGQIEKKVTQPEQSGEQQGVKEPLPIPADIKAEIDAILQPLADDEIFKDAVPALGAMATTMSNHYEAKYKKQQEEVSRMQEQFQQELQSLGYLKTDAAIERTRAELLGIKYPQLKDKSSHDKVLEMYDTFAASGRYDEKTPEQVYAEAADYVLGKDNAMSFSEALAQRHLSRKKAQPTLPTNKAPSTAAMTQDDKDRLAFNRIKRQSAPGNG